MEVRKFTAGGKEVTLYPASISDRPLIVLNTYTGNGKSVAEELGKLNAPDHNLLVIGNLNWDHDMCPWECPALSKNDTPCTGGADEYLGLLLSEILPKAKKMLVGQPAFTAITGYSLAGLFALYALYRCEEFDRAASMSGSLWFPDFTDYVFKHEMLRKPEKLYLSLGDKEARTQQTLLKTVQHNTEAITEHYRSQGIDVIFEMNEGNHFKEPALRSAKGIIAIYGGGVKALSVQRCRAGDRSCIYGRGRAVVHDRLHCSEG